MTGIQFLDAGGNVLPDPADEEPAPPGLRRHRLLAPNTSWPRSRRGIALAVAAPALWLAAAALAVLAAFQDVYRERIQSNVLFVLSADGWGRYGAGSNPPVDGHGIRYGLLLCAGAVVFVLAAVVSVLRRRAAGVLAAAGAAALAGCVATVWLEVRTGFDLIRAAFARSEVPAPRALDLRYGPLLWLGGAAALVAALGCVAAALIGGSGPRSEKSTDEADLTDAEGGEPGSDELVGEAIG